MRAFGVVEQFEEAVAAFAGAPYAVAVNTGTSAIFLSLKWIQTQIHDAGPVIVPARTFVSVPMACLHADIPVMFKDFAWKGVYQLKPYPIWDGALRFRRKMYHGGLHCLSFHARKILNIGEGGMILTDDREAYDWLKKASYSGRDPENNYRVEDIEMLGWQLYMTPEKAARGLHLMEYVGNGEEDQVVEYPDLRKAPVFRPRKGDLRSMLMQEEAEAMRAA